MHSTPSPTPAAGAGGLGNLGGMADMFRNAGGGGGGMPDIASMMNNPQLMAMAQQLMANGGMNSLLSNPAVANMVRTSAFNSWSLFYKNHVSPSCVAP